MFSSQATDGLKLVAHPVGHVHSLGLTVCLPRSHISKMEISKQSVYPKSDTGGEVENDARFELACVHSEREN